MTPLYGHVSPETSYVVNDYPYGFQLRCKIRYWLERHPKRGWRFCSQTTNPKRGDTWNKPKASTYVRFAACMFLNDENHVTWDGISEYAEAPNALAFVQKYPGADMSTLVDWATMKACFEDQCATGNIVCTINGQVRPDSEADTARHVADAATWKQVATLLGRPIAA